MSSYMAKYIHRISPNENDIEGPFEISGNAFSDKTALAKALRKAGVLDAGDRLSSFRVEGDKVIVFPGRPSVWHSITLTEGAYKAPGVSYPGYSGKRNVPKRSKTKRSTKKRKLTNLRRVRLRGFGVRRHGVSMPAYSTMLSRVEIGNKSYHYLLDTITKRTKISPHFAKSLLEIIQLRLYEGRITSEEAQLLAAFVEARR